MIGLNNADSSFFTIDSDDVDLSTEVISEDVVSLTVTEEIGKITTGNLLLQDHNLLYPTLLRMGITLKVSWGYKDVDDNLRTLLALNENPTEVTGGLFREGMTGYIMSPSGGGSQNGYSFYNCSFYGSEFSRNVERRVYKKGTKSSVVSEVFTRIGVTLWEISFNRGSESITSDTQLIQWESDFKFLQRSARDWRCIFRIGYMPSGQLYGMFVDHDQFDNTQFQKIVTGASFGNSVTFNWKWGVSNVISYTWKNHAGESGTGDHVKMVVINGKTTFIRYVAENQTVRAYRFVPEKINEELKRRLSKGGISSTTDYMKWALNVEDFQELVQKGYFVPYDQSTAPQGLGYSSEIKTLGNPLITPPMRVELGKGFPDTLANTQSKLFIRKVVHTLDKNGYKIDASVVDTLTATGGSFVI